MGTSDLPDVYALTFRAPALVLVCIYIRQISFLHVTTITLILILLRLDWYTDVWIMEFLSDSVECSIRVFLIQEVSSLLPLN